MTARLTGSRAGQAAVLLAVCALVYWVALGSRPFDYSEGHRVIPAWTMLDSGDWWHVKMFGLTYLRKPPGMAWAIAACSALFGQTEFGARAVSAACATVMAIAAWGFARRWFGPDGPCALAAGLAQALMPLMWSPGRTAEIEMLNNLGAQFMAFGLIDLCLAGLERPGQAHSRSDTRSRVSLTGIVFAAAGIVIAALAKGPAAAPVPIAIMVGACVLARSARPLRTPGMWVALALAAGILIPVGLRVVALNGGDDAVREELGQFLWSRDRIVGVATLLPLAFASALPMSVALVFPFGLDARAEAGSDAQSSRALAAARLCAASWFIAIGLLMLSGVNNARYAMPAAVLLPPAVGYAVRGCAGSFGAARRTLASRLIIGRPVFWAPPLLVATLTSTYLLTGPRRGDADAGLAAARVLAHALPPGAEVWADDAIEARPDVLLYARRLGPRSPPIEPRWAKPRMLRGELPAPGGSTFVLLRMDPGSAEHDRYAPAIADGRLQSVRDARVRSFECSLFRVAR